MLNRGTALRGLLRRDHNAPADLLPKGMDLGAQCWKSGTPLVLSPAIKEARARGESLRLQDALNRITKAPVCTRPQASFPSADYRA